MWTLIIIYFTGVILASVLTYCQTAKAFEKEYEFKRGEAVAFAVILGIGSWFTAACNLMILWHKHNNRKGGEQ